MKDEFSSIGEIVKILKGSKAPEVFDKPRPGAFPYLQIEDLRPDATPKYAIDKDGTLATKTDVLIAWDGANAGTIGFDLEGYVGSTIAILRPTRDDIHAPYLGYFLRSKFEDIQENTTGATIPHVSRGYLENLKIPLPPLTEQKRIASLLARADRVRRLRRTASDLGNSLLQSVFLEMFGDPESNSRKWQFSTFGELSTFITSGSRGWAEYYSSSGARFIRVQDLRGNRVNFENMAYVMPKDKAEMTRTKVKPYDLLLAITGATIGLSALVPENIGEAYVNQHVAIIRLKEEINHQYAAAFMAHSLGGQKQIASLQYGDTKPGMSLEQIKDLKIPLPPLSLQEEFAGMVARVESVRGRMGESARQVENLFASLLSQSFGERQ